MNHCLDCGKNVNRGRTGGSSERERCLVCEQRRLFDGWRYETPMMKLRKLARRDDEASDGT